MDMDLITFKALQNRLSREGLLELRIASNSMEPVLKKDDLITVTETKKSSLKKFDIIVFWQNNQIICHFLWSIQTTRSGEELFISKSLKKPKEIDDPIKEGLLLGKANAKIPLYFKLKMLLQN